MKEKIEQTEKPAEQVPEAQVPDSLWPLWVKSTAGFIFETLKIVIISLAIILPIRYFLIQPFYVKGASMEPSFHDYQYLLIDEISYRLAEPRRGDIVVFRYPEDPSQYFIKRVIGLPGERVEVDNGKILITPVSPNATEILVEPYLADASETECLKLYNCQLPTTLGPDEYFMMGDNRPASLDSRYFGPVNRSEIVGKAWLRVWPFSTFTVFQGQSYNL